MWLQEQQTKGLVHVYRAYVKSTHRHKKKLLWLLDSLHYADPEKKVDVIIAGAGKAAALPGDIDAYLRNELGDTSIKVVGVAFKSKTKGDDEAAALSITKVPGTQVTYAGQGEAGFLKACKMALDDSLPEIHLAEIPPSLDLNLAQFIELAEQQ